MVPMYSRDLDWRVESAVFGSAVVHEGVSRNADFVPPYSADLPSAWLVVEKMREKDEHGPRFSFRCDDNYGVSWWACFEKSIRPDMPRYEAEGATLPEAICLAALKAMSKTAGLRSEGEK